METQLLEPKNERRYRGYSNILECYHAQPEEIKELGRWELSKTDSGLYRKLYREGEIDVIPKRRCGRPRLSQGKVNSILLLFKTICERSITKTAKISGVSRYAVSKYVRKAGEEPKIIRRRKIS